MNFFDEDQSVFSGHFEVDIVVDRSAAEVWTTFVDTRQWVTSHVIENVYGDPGTVGSITRVSSPDAVDWPPAPYHYCKLIEVIPGHRWVIKTYSEKGGSYGLHMSGFDEGRLIEIDG